MIATSGFLVALECTKFVLGRGYVPGQTGGAYSVPPDLLAGLSGPTSKGRGRRGKGKGREEWERKGTGVPPFRKFLDPPLITHWACPTIARWYCMCDRRHRPHRRRYRRRPALSRITGRSLVRSANRRTRIVTPLIIRRTNAQQLQNLQESAPSCDYGPATANREFFEFAFVKIRIQIQNYLELQKITLYIETVFDSGVCIFP